MDERLANIEKQKQAALQQSNDAYSGLFQNNQNLYNQQNAYAEQYEQTQNDALDKQLAFYEQKINQNVLKMIISTMLIRMEFKQKAWQVVDYLIVVCQKLQN